MGFLTGRVTCTRFKANAPSMFGVDHLDRLADHAIGKQRISTKDGSQWGWIAGDHILDTHFDLSKNVVNDSLQFALRLDEHKIPGGLLQAYTLMELKEFAASNPSGFASSKQKREARIIAKERLEEEAKDGRFIRKKLIPVMWDAVRNELLIGTTSRSSIDLVCDHFHHTFDCKTQAITAASVEDRELATPSVFVPSHNCEVAWAGDSHDFLGNEFLMWLWFYLSGTSDSVKLADDSEVAIMFTRSLMLDCPRGQTGRDTITGDNPTRMPEALRAIEAGKLPRKAGLMMVRQEMAYQFALQAESMAISSAKMPRPESEDTASIAAERVGQIRHMLETVDLLYNAFLNLRFSDGWVTEVNRIGSWLRKREAA